MTPSVLRDAQIIWDYMRYETLLKKADVILCLGSYDIRSAEWAAKLWHDGWAPKILFSGDRGAATHNLPYPESDRFAMRAIEIGVPEEVIVRENQSRNTGENIRFSYEVLRQTDTPHDTIILVTKPYMLRRAYATFMRQWPDGIKPHIVLSGLDISMEEYLMTEILGAELALNTMVGDLQRIRRYSTRGFSIEQEIPNDVWQAYERLVEAGYSKRLL